MEVFKELNTAASIHEDDERKLDKIIVARGSITRPTKQRTSLEPMTIIFILPFWRTCGQRGRD
jgi:hypothetical protein